MDYLEHQATAKQPMMSRTEPLPQMEQAEMTYINTQSNTVDHVAASPLLAGQVSLFPSTFNTQSTGAASVGEILQGIKQGKFNPTIVQAAREAKARLIAAEQEFGKGSSEYETAKRHLNRTKQKQELVTWNCIMQGGRSLEAVKALSGVMYTDIDTPGVTLEQIAEFGPLAVWRSISGKGWGMLWAVEGSLAEFPFIFHHIQATTGLQFDGQCKDVSRQNYLSFDPDLWLNPSAEVPVWRAATPSVTPQIQHSAGASESGTFRVPIGLKQELASIKRSARGVLPKHLQLLLGEFGAEMVRTQPGERNGIIYSAGQRALSRCKDNLEQFELLDYLVQMGQATGHEAKQVEATLESAMQSAAGQPKPYLYMPPSEATAGVWKAIYRDRVRFNLRSQQTELDGTPCPNLESIIDEDLSSGENKIRTIDRTTLQHAIRNRIVSESYDPLQEWLEDLPEATGTETLDALLDQIGVTHALERRLFKMHMIAAVKRVRQPGCKVDSVLILAGKQGIGKTSLLQALSKGSFTSLKDDLGNKDTLAGLSRAWFVNLDEANRIMGKADRNKLKEFITESVDRYRPPYAKAEETFPRRCVFWGSSNERDILTDPTGNRRYWIVEMTQQPDWDWLDANIDAIWSEANSAYLRGERHWLNTEELAELDAYHRSVSMASSAQDALWQDLLYASCSRLDLQSHDALKPIVEASKRGWNGNRIVLTQSEFASLDALVPAPNARAAVAARCDALRSIGFTAKSVKVSGRVVKSWVLEGEALEAWVQATSAMGPSETPADEEVEF